MVSTSKVFAAGSIPANQPAGQGLAIAPIPLAPVNNKRSAQWQITSPGVMCSTDGGMRVDSYAVVGQVNGNLDVSVNPAGSAFVQGAGFVTVLVNGTGPGNSPFRRGDGFEFTWYVRYVCLDANLNPIGWQCRNYHYMYVNQANGNPNWQLAAMPTVTTPGTCTTPSP